jgi:hypothetical protein
MEQKAIGKNFSRLVWVLFAGFAAWWLYITLFVRGGTHDSVNNQAFAATYGVIALLGSVVGLKASKIWGGHKSLIGRALLFFSIGLFAQEFGQIAYSIYLYALKVQIPYPSVGDVGYFSSVFFYIYAAIQLLKATGAKFTLKDRNKKLIATILPLILLGASYAYFLRDYHFDFSSLKAGITVILDFGYPLGQATYIAIALLTFLLSRSLLGGIMKRKVLFILLALVVQYTADFSFLYAAKAAKAFPAGANDFVYLVSYTLMALALNSYRVKLGQPADKPEAEETA